MVSSSLPLSSQSLSSQSLSPQSLSARNASEASPKNSTFGYGYLKRDGYLKREASSPQRAQASALSSTSSFSTGNLSTAYRFLLSSSLLSRTALTENIQLPNLPFSLSPLSWNIPSLPSFPSFQNYFCPDLALDLGTTNTLISIKGEGIILNEPTLVAFNKYTRKPIAAGLEAKKFYGKTNDEIALIRPIKDGVICSFSLTQYLIRSLIKRAIQKNYLGKPKMVIAIPSQITPVEKRAVRDAAICAGAREVKLVQEPLAAALGAGLPVEKPVGSMIIDIGGGTTDVAILSLGGTVYTRSLRTAGDEMDEAIQRYLRRHFGMQIGIYEAERLKIQLGSALPSGRLELTKTSGSDIKTGLPLQAKVSNEVIRDALSEPLNNIFSCIKIALENTNPEIAHDIMSQGIFLTGGGALLTGLAERLYRETGIPIQIAAEPSLSVAYGVGVIADNMKTMSGLCTQ